MAQHGRSKLAAVLYSRYLARHLTSTHPNILANATHPGIVETRQNSEYVKEQYPLGGYVMSAGMAPFKEAQCEGAVSTMYAAAVTEEWVVCLPIGHSGTGKRVSLDEELGERLINLTWRVIKERPKPSSSDKGCPFKEY